MLSVRNNGRNVPLIDLQSVNMNLTVTILSTASISSNESVKIRDLAQRVFPPQPGDWTWATADWWVLVRVGEILVSQLEIIERVGLVNQRPIRLGGIGGVATLPEYRRQGFATLAMRRAAEYMRDPLAVEFGLLICEPRMEGYYTRLGWQTIAAAMFFAQPDRRGQNDGLTMVLPVLGNCWPDGEVDLCGLPW